MENVNLDLKKIREYAGITQVQASTFLGVSLRSYKEYENNEGKRNTLKYKMMLSALSDEYRIDEEHGILSTKDIVTTVQSILKKYNVSYCYLFGSYAKGFAKGDSDVDLLISGEVKGINYYGLIEELRLGLNKRVDLLDTNQIIKNPALLEEIMKDGIKIYG